MVCYPVFCGPYRCMRLHYLALSRFNSTATNTCEWLGVPPCFSKVGLYTNSGNLQLPISSLVEFKIGKVHLHMMMKDSANKIIWKVYPEIKSGTKWLAVKAAQEVECSLWIKDLIGVTQTNRAGLNSTSNKVFFKVGPKGKRDMVLFTNPFARAGYDTRSIFKRSLTGLNSEFSFS